MFVSLAAVNYTTGRSCWTRSRMCYTWGRCKYPDFMCIIFSILAFPVTMCWKVGCTGIGQTWWHGSGRQRIVLKVLKCRAVSTLGTEHSEQYDIVFTRETNLGELSLNDSATSRPEQHIQKPRGGDAFRVLMGGTSCLGDPFIQYRKFSQERYAGRVAERTRRCAVPPLWLFSKRWRLLRVLFSTSYTEGWPIRRLQKLVQLCTF